MTHGHIIFKNSDAVGTNGQTEVYTYHDGQIRDAVMDIATLIPNIFQRSVAYTKAWIRDGNYDSVKMFPSGPFVPTKNIGEHFDELQLKKLLSRGIGMPDGITAAILANWFCSLHWNRWMILPREEMAYPSANLTIEIELLQDSLRKHANYLIQVKYEGQNLEYKEAIKKDIPQTEGITIGEAKTNQLFTLDVKEQWIHEVIQAYKNSPEG